MFLQTLETDCFNGCRMHRNATCHAGPQWHGRVLTSTCLWSTLNPIPISLGWMLTCFRALCWRSGKSQLWYRLAGTPPGLKALFVSCNALVNLCLPFIITLNQQVQDKTQRLEGSGKDYKKLNILLQLKAKKSSLRNFQIRSSQNTYGKSVNQPCVSSDTWICFCFYTDSKKISVKLTWIKEY